MSRASGSYKRLKKYHKWFSILLALFILVFALSGMILNHRQWLSGTDVNRRWLPDEYQYHNWNLAALRGSMAPGHDSTLVYGNVGVWLMTRDSTFTDFNQGFPPGIDNRKVSKIIRTADGRLLAGTFFGLYQRKKGAWEKCRLPVEEERITDLFQANGAVMVLTRSHLLQRRLHESRMQFGVVALPPALDDDGKAGLFETLWVIHSGGIWGIPGKLFVDFVGLVFIFLTLTGLMLWLFPGWIKILKRRGRRVKSLARSMKFSLKWHNRLGYYLTAFLVITTLSGMFLRPPLLIPIANSRVGKIPYTSLNNPNPWHDKLRAAIYDAPNHRYIFSTSQGFYAAGQDLALPMVPFATQPPVSVMGINVFEKTNNSGFLVGSFSGLYQWYPEKNYIENLYTHTRWHPSKTAGKPFGAHAVAGLVRNNQNQSFILDYETGAEPFMQHGHFPAMPQQVLLSSPVSLWNTALEFHTGRIYHALIGDFYILIVPLVGLSVLFLVVSGFIMYRVGFRKKHKQPAKKNQHIPDHQKTTPQHAL